MKAFTFLALMALAVAQTARGGLIHRYSFTNTGNLTVLDSVGGAHGEIKGGAYYTANGELQLEGIDGYVQLPSGMISKLTNATFEFWFTYQGSGPWARIYDFGDSILGEDSGQNPLDGGKIDGATSFICMVARSGHNPNFLFNVAGINGVQPDQQFSDPLQLNREYHLVVSFDAVGQRVTLMVDGVAKGGSGNQFPLRLLRDAFNYLGRSNWGVDPYMAGKYNEFRIHDHAFTRLEGFSSFRAGPNPEQLPPGVNLAALESLRLAAVLPVAADAFRELRLTGVFPGGREVDLTYHPDVVYTSSHPATASLPARGLVYGAGPGSATVTAALGGKSATQNVRVQLAAANHRFSFNESSGNVSTNRMGNGNALLHPGATLSNGRVSLNQALRGYVELPDGVVSSCTNLTVELWTTWRGNPGLEFQRMWDFGSSRPVGINTEGFTDFLMVPANYLDNRMSFYSRGRMSGVMWNWCVYQGAYMPLSQEVHVVLTYNYLAGVSRMYLNGVETGSGMILGPPWQILDTNCWLGKSQWNVDPIYNGEYNEVRIWPAALTRDQVLTNYLEGPNHDGVYSHVRLEVPRRTLATGQTLQARAVAVYTRKIEEVTASPQTQYESGNTGVATISPTGLIQAVAPGKTWLKAVHQGEESLFELLVYTPQPARLKHRYSMDLMEGDVVVPDSVGGAHGTLVFPEGVTWDYPGEIDFLGYGAYVDLPNGLLSSLTTVTVEAWMRGDAFGFWNSGARLFDFGSSMEGEGFSGTQTTGFFLTPWSHEGEMVFGVFTNGFSPLAEVLRSAPGNPESMVHLAVVYDPLEGVSRLYRNGSLMQTGPAPVDLAGLADLNSWIGRSNGPEPYFLGRLDEFRIYEGAMTSSEVQQSFQKGPNLSPTSGLLRIAGVEAQGSRLRFRILTDIPSATWVLQESSGIGPAQWSDLGGVSIQTVAPGELSAETDQPSGIRFYRVVAR